LLKAIKADAQLSDLPVMLITNYPQHMSAAVLAGAVPGFGKAQLRESATLEILRPFLS
jgi:two-component system chemotaxis response regulator CheY